MYSGFIEIDLESLFNIDLLDIQFYPLICIKF